MSHRRDETAAEVCIPAFISTMFGITEPAIYGVNLPNKHPFLGGSIGGAVGGAIMYAGNVAALSFGPTMIPGLALCDPSSNGYLWYIAGNVASPVVGFCATLALSLWTRQAEAPAV